MVKIYNMSHRIFKLISIYLLTFGQTLALIPSHNTRLTPFERMKHLDLIWQIREQMDVCDVSIEEICGHVCEICEGEGELPCRFCGGTGFLMLGHDLIGTNNDCPVCRGTGYEECPDCMGAGYIVDWREEYD